MKIAHTADWHLGKTLRGKDRDQEHRAVSREFLKILEKECVDVLLLAGDTFDSFTPSAASEEIAYGFLYDVSRLGIRTVMISGNHDSGFRFEALSRIMALAGVSMLGFWRPGKSEKILEIEGKDRSKVRIAALPFVSERMFIRSADPIDSNMESLHSLYSTEMGKVLDRLSLSFRDDATNFLVGHMLMHGAKPGTSERRLFLGDNYAVHPDEIPPQVDYVALGHIHLRQKIDAPAPVHYCGSPIQLDFGERDSEKGFLLLEASPGRKCEPRFVELQSGKQLVELKGTLEEVQSAIESEPRLSESYLKIVLTADETSPEAPFRLKKTFPNAVDIRREASESRREFIPRSGDALPRLYEEFYRRQYGHEIPPAMAREFQELHRACLPEGSTEA